MIGILDIQKVILVKDVGVSYLIIVLGQIISISCLCITMLYLSMCLSCSSFRLQFVLMFDVWFISICLHRIGNLVQSTIMRLLYATCPSCPSHWISVCRNMVRYFWENVVSYFQCCHIIGRWLPGKVLMYFRSILHVFPVTLMWFLLLPLDMYLDVYLIGSSICVAFRCKSTKFTVWCCIIKTS